MTRFPQPPIPVVCRVLSLGAGYLLLMTAWGAANLWPSSLTRCLFFFPVAAGATALFLRRRKFPPAPERGTTHWQWLIVTLIGACAMASGKMTLLMLAGLAMFLVAFQPTGGAFALEDWFKVVSWMAACFPFWLDFQGGSFDPTPVITESGAGGDSGSTALFHASFLLALLATGFLLPAGNFWTAWAVAAAVGTGAFFFWSQRVPQTVGVATLIGVGGLLLAWLSSRTLLSARWREKSLLRPFFHWLGRGNRSGWAVLGVVIIQQPTLPWRCWLAVAITAASLIWRRPRAATAPDDHRPRLLQMASLLLLLAGEWTDSMPLRTWALVPALLGLGGAAAWSCTAWLGALTLGWIMAPAGPLIAPGRFAWPAWIALLLLDRRRTVKKGPVWPDEEWRAWKRLALILLLLLLGFQAGASFHGPAPGPASAGLGIDADWPGCAEVRHTVESASGLETWTARVVGPPVAVETPERLFARLGWTVENRRVHPHVQGRFVVLTVVRQGQRRVAAWRFAHDNRIFADHSRARGILWSGWNLAHREVTLRLALAPGTDPGPLLPGAASIFWQPEP